jgi:hypothetical protein
VGTVLRTEEEIRAAGRKAVAGWTLSDRQVDQIVALLTPVRNDVWQVLQDSEQIQRPAA